VIGKNEYSTGFIYKYRTRKDLKTDTVDRQNAAGERITTKNPRARIEEVMSLVSVAQDHVTNNCSSAW
jgi:hypothetical protein